MYSVSMIMPVYNKEHTIGKRIDSILKQTLYDFELIIINDGSTDQTSLICEQYEREEPLIIKVINQKRKGYATARNRGLAAAKGKYIYFVEENTSFHKNMLLDNLKLAQENDADLVIFGFEQQLTDEGTTETIFLPNIPQLKNQKQFRKHYRNFHDFFPYLLTNKLYKQSFLKKEQIYFDETSDMEEILFNLSVYKDIYSVAVNRKKLCFLHDDFIELKTSSSPFKFKIKQAAMLEQMISYWNKQTVFNDVIFEEYFSIINNELISILKNNSSSSTKRPKEEIKIVFENPDVARFLQQFKNIKIKNPFKKALFSSFLKQNIDKIMNLLILNEGIVNRKEKIINFMNKLF